jgi:predicted MPP superfamily phosphohydrolase
MLRKLLLSAFLGLALPAQTVSFVFTSDAHYGLTRRHFRGASDVDAHTVNAALVAQLNTLPGLALPRDGGVKAGQTIGPIAFVAEGGDIASRSEKGVQPSAVSWAQVRTDYLQGLAVPVFITPGNHDASNALGFVKPMARDATAMAEIHNRMLAPAPPRSAADFDYARDKVDYSRDVEGLHLAFVQIWPDAAGRAWLEQDLAKARPGAPVLLFMHDPPAVATSHFTNPNGDHGLSRADKFENLLGQVASEAGVQEPSLREQRELEAFLRAHRNIVACFHGHANWNEFYDWKGPDGTLALPVFRVDSPVKGRDSARDERKLSFQLVVADLTARRMTVRECLWNTDPGHGGGPIAFGAARTISLEPRP